MPSAGRPRKPAFADLAEEFKDKVHSASREEIMAMFAQVGKALADNNEAKKNDEDLKEKKEIANFAGAQYREASKVFKQQLEFLRLALQDKGGS